MMEKCQEKHQTLQSNHGRFGSFVSIFVMVSIGACQNPGSQWEKKIGSFLGREPALNLQYFHCELVFWQGPINRYSGIPQENIYIPYPSFSSDSRCLILVFTVTGSMITLRYSISILTLIFQMPPEVRCFGYVFGVQSYLLTLGVWKGKFHVLMGYGYCISLEGPILGFV